MVGIVAVSCFDVVAVVFVRLFVVVIDSAVVIRVVVAVVVVFGMPLRLYNSLHMYSRQQRDNLLVNPAEQSMLSDF